MTPRSWKLAILTAAWCLALTACRNPPGKPGADAEAPPPDQVSSFAALYQQNCAACHGENGVHGAAISLANPAYITTAGLGNIQRVMAQGVPGTLMPGFGKTAGGLLTDAQVAMLAEGIVSSWGRPSDFQGVTPLPYAASSSGDAARGQAAYATFCQRCHGGETPAQPTGVVARSNSILDPTYLALISDQGLRSLLIAGHTDPRMDWRSYVSGASPRALTDAEATDIVGWMASHRVANPGQPYPQHP